MYVCNSFKKQQQWKPTTNAILIIILKEGVLWRRVHYCVTNLGTRYIWQCKIKMQCQIHIISTHYTYGNAKLKCSAKIHITSTHYSMGQVSESLCLNSNGETFKNKSPNTVMKENSSSSSSRSQ